MGAVKSVPVVGEVVTVADMAVKCVAGTVVAPFSTDTAEKFFDAAGHSFVDYAERSPVQAVVHSAVALFDDDAKAGLADHWKKVGSSAVELVDGMPVVGHVKGVYHYLDGDKEAGDQCMKAASRSTAVVGATVLTGGLGAGWAATAAVTSGLAMDEVTTVADSLIHDEFRPSGHLASICHAIDSGDPTAYLDAATGVAFEFTAAYLTADNGKMADKRNTSRAFRVMDSEAAETAVRETNLPRGHQAGNRPTGLTYVSESVEHSKYFEPKQQAKAPANIKLDTVQLKFDKSYFNDLKSAAVDQSGASSQPTLNVKNVEHVPKGRVNIGIRNANLDGFNTNVLDAKRINVKSWRYKNGVTKAVSRYGAAAAEDAALHSAVAAFRDEDSSADEWDD